MYNLTEICYILLGLRRKEQNETDQGNKKYKESKYDLVNLAFLGK